MKYGLELDQHYRAAALCSRLRRDLQELSGLLRGKVPLRTTDRILTARSRVDAAQLELDDLFMADFAGQSPHFPPIGHVVPIEQSGLEKLTDRNPGGQR